MSRNDQDIQEHVEECHVLIDLLREENAELKAENKILREAVKRWKTTRRIEVA